MSYLSERIIRAQRHERARAKCVHPNGQFTNVRREEIERSIPDRFERIVRQYPNRTAIQAPDCTLSYAELNSCANRVARAILQMPVEGRYRPILLLFDHGADAVIAILGTLKSGAFYVPVDSSLPLVRIEAIFRDSGAGVVVTDTKHLDLAERLSIHGAEILDVDTLGASVSDENLLIPLEPTTHACIMYTSGSTGEPKGVLQNHRGILHKAMVYTNLLHICPSDRLTLLHNTCFDACMHHLYGSLLNGASLFPFNPRLQGSEALSNWLMREQISIYHSVPMIFLQMAESLNGRKAFSKLRAVTLSGSSMNTKDVELYKSLFPLECVLFHMMGTTETGWVRGYAMDRATEIIGYEVPIGYEIENKNVTLLNDNGKPVETGEVGQIAVKSRYLSQGYWKRPELTAAKFLPDLAGGRERIYLTGDIGKMDAEGCLVHLGRKDFQVKIRGHRIEVEEVEAVLQSQDNVREAVVAKWTAGVNGDEHLLAYVVPMSQPAPAINKLRRAISEKLPTYMIPSAFMFLDALPLTPAGKHDRKALPCPEKIRPELDTAFVAPRSPLERDLANIWAEVLPVDQIGVYDNFFDLGGHSLAASMVVTRLLQKFQFEIPIKAVFECPTVAEMARVITEHKRKTASSDRLEIILIDLEELSDEEAQQIVDRERRRKEKM